MSILEMFGFGSKPDDEKPGNGDTATVRKIAAELEGLPREQARYVAAFAYILGRAANADRVIH